MKAKDIEKSKPRNFVAKNAKMGGAGAHKDKKKAAKQGDVKHKSKEMAEAADFVNTMIAEGRMMDYLPPFRAMGFSVDDRRGNSVLEANDQGVAKEIAALLNKAFPPRQATGISKEGFVSELSKGTLSNYSDKADMDIVKKHRVRGPQSQAGDKAAVAKTDKKIDKRMKGIDSAAKRLNNESLETKLAQRVNSLLIEGAGVSDSHKKLASEYSDFHKDLHGMRPKHNENEWHDEEFLQAQIDKLHATLDKMKSTPEGREALKADGWILDHEPAEDIEEGEVERQHGDLKPWAYWQSPERVAKKLYQIHQGAPISKAEIVQLWKEDGPDRMTKFMLKPDVAAIISAYDQMSDEGPLFKEGEFRRPGSPTAYDRDYASSVSGMGHKQSQAYQQDGGANDEGWGKEKYQHPEDKPRLLGYYFYDVPAGKEGEAAIYGVKKTKSGKWAKAKYSTSGRSYGMQKDGADKAFGPGKWWAPK